ncbi:heme peroxidase [Ephemerocybe angulata]|uniref:Heme peroxidase n=1 Tax=Ephemerocybe angulata TaxID=980116 RepID=A0A8H6M7A6_9AGAR|nr:heme peroxidase [Tulosesus angulatus]
MASLLGRLLERALSSKDEEADIILAASSPTASKKAALTDVETKKIDAFLKLADSNEIDIRARLAAYRGCNAAISKLPPGAAKRAEVLKKCFTVVCPLRGRVAVRSRAAVPALSSEPNSYHRLVDEAATVHPEADDVFERLLEARDTVAHPSGLASLTFSFANLIGVCIYTRGIRVLLCKSYPHYENPNVNQTSGLLDLYPLSTVRVIEPEEIGWGLLQADAFFEVATSVLLILFSRNHNSIARRLLKENQQKRWVEPTTLEEGGDERQLQDDEIFKLAKRVNCAVFRQIVSTDFLKGLLGLSPVDEAPSVDLISSSDAPESYANSVEFCLLYSWLSTVSQHEVDAIKENLTQIDSDPETLTAEELETFLSSYGEVADLDRGTRPCVGLAREDGNKFNDSELAAILQKASEIGASAFRPQGTAPVLSVFDTWKVCTFNRFRESLGLAPYKSFEEWCSNAEAFTLAIDNLELYPGLRGEKVLDGKGLSLGETMTYGLIADIVQTIRSDPAFKEDEKRTKSPSWGPTWSRPSPTTGHSDLPCLVSSWTASQTSYNHNSSYGLCPFATPEKAKELLKEREEEAAKEGKPLIPGPDDIDFDKPKPTTTHTITDPEGAKQVLNSDKFENPLADDIGKLTDGLGILLGFDKDSHAADDHRTISSFLADKGAAQRYADFLSEAIKRYLLRYRKKVGNRFKVNYQDVINSAVAAFAAEILCGVTLDQPRKLTAPDFFQKLKDINDTLSGEVAPQEKFVVLKRATDAARLIRLLIEQGLNKAVEDPHEHTWLEGIIHFLREILLDEPHNHNSTSHYFLARLAASGKDKKELSANVLAFAVTISIQFAKTLGTGVSFYMDDSHDDTRATLKSLASDPNSSIDTILGYAREAERLSQNGPSRLVAKEDVVITLSTGETVEIKKGERVVVDPSVEDKTIDPSRPVDKSFIPSIEGVRFFLLRSRRSLGLQDVQPAGVNFLTYIDNKKRKDVQFGVRKGDVPWIQRFFDVIYLALALYLLSWAWTATGNAIYRLNTFSCANPTHIRPWESYTMLPGPDNRTMPFIVTLDSPKKRRITFVDLDQRDMQFKVSVDGRKKAVSSDFVLDRRIDCGDRVEQCLEMGFSTVQVIIPSGKKTIKLEWIGKGTFPFV